MRVKQALSQDDADTLAYYIKQILTGAAAGTSVAAGISMYHDFNMRKEREKELKRRREGSSDDIIIRLPAKSADVLDRMVDTVREYPELREVVVGSMPNRDVDSGRYTSSDLFKTARTRQRSVNAGQHATGILLMMLSALAAGKGVHSLYDTYRTKQLKDEVAQAEEDYTGALLNKEAKTSLRRLGRAFQTQFSPGVGDSLASLGLLSLLFGAFGSGYLTKRVLDSHAERIEKQHLDTALPAPSRIIIKRVPKDIQPEQAIEEDPDALDTTDIDALKVAYCIINDVVTGDMKLEKNAKFVAACNKAGTSFNKLAKLLDDSEYITSEVLNKIPREVINALAER